MTAATVAALLALGLSAVVGDESLEFTMQTKLYSALQQFPCTRLITAEAGSVGCSSSVDGNSGTYFLVETSADVDRFFETDPAIARILVLFPQFATASTVRSLHKHGNVQGAIVLPTGVAWSNGTSTSPAWSPLAPSQWSLAPGVGGGDTAADSGVQYIQHPWVGSGSSLAATLYPIPMITVAGADADETLRRGRANRERGADSYPAFAARMWFPMGPADLDSVGCLSEGTCDYMGGQSAWASSTPLWANYTPADPRPAHSSYVLAATAGDATAQFHDRAFGANAAVSGIVAVIAAASALGQGHLAGQWDLAALPRGMLWGVFQGEALAHLGSRQWIQDIQDFSCPTANQRVDNDSPTGKPLCLSPVRTDLAFEAINATSDIVHAIAVQQVGTPGPPPQAPPGLGLYTHGLAATAPEAAGAPALLQGVLSTLGTAAGTPVNVSAVQAVPPSPLDALRSTSPLVNGAVLTRGAGAEYANAYYGSMLDTADNLDATAVTEAATLLARSMYALASAAPNVSSSVAAVPPGISADPGLVADLISCFTVDAQCTLFAAALNRGVASLPSGPLSLFTGIFQRPVVSGSRIAVPSSLAEAVIKNLLSNATATTLNGTCETTVQCAVSTGRNEFECLFGRCVVGNAYLHDAKSPLITDALRIRTGGVSAVHPLWTEPVWSAEVGVQVYVQDAPGSGIAMLVVGLLLTAGWCMAMGRLNTFVRTRYKVL